MKRTLALCLCLLAACGLKAASIGALDTAAGDTASKPATQQPDPLTFFAGKTQDITGTWVHGSHWYRFGKPFDRYVGHTDGGLYDLIYGTLKLSISAPADGGVVKLNAYRYDKGLAIGLYVPRDVLKPGPIGIWERTTTTQIDTHTSTEIDRYTFLDDGTFARDTTFDVGDGSEPTTTTASGTWAATAADRFELDEGGTRSEWTLVDAGALVNETEHLYVPGTIPSPTLPTGCKYFVEADCTANPACRYLVPGCLNRETPAPVGCYPKDECGPGSCGQGEVCAMVHYDPCHGQMCLACATETYVCYSCLGAWKDQFGYCRSPSDGGYPAQCCAGL